MTNSMPVALLMVSTAIAAPPAQDSITTVLGPKAYRDGDVIVILKIMRMEKYLRGRRCFPSL